MSTVAFCGSLHPSSYTKSRPKSRRPHLDLDVFHDGLIALSAVVADRAKHVHFGHVARFAAARDVVGDSKVSLQRTLATVPCDARDVDGGELTKSQFAHVIRIHKDQCPQILD